MKQCNQCKEHKSIEYFSKDSSQKDSFSSKCKMCRSINDKKLVQSGYYKERYLINRDNILAKQRADPKTKERKKIYRKNNPHKTRQYKLNELGVFYTLGKRFTVSDYQVEVEKCLNNCMICSKTVEENKKNLAVDHDHETGLYRGLLCSTCNITLGLVNDNTLLLKRMINYLNKSKNGI